MNNNIDNNNRMFASEEEYKFNINGKNINISDEIKNRKEKEISDGIKKYMPIGSVITVENNNTMIMIVGFKYYDNNNKEYDYIGCVYPFGIGNKYSTVLFNHEQISRIYYLGYINNQERNFKEELNNQSDFSKFLIK